MTYEIEVVAAVYSPTGFLLVRRGDTLSLPSCPLPPDRPDSRGVAAELIERVTGVAVGRWLLVSQVGFVDRPGTTKAVLYACSFPEELPPADRNAVWVPPSRVQAGAGVDQETILLSMAAVNINATRGLSQDHLPGS